ILSFNGINAFTNEKEEKCLEMAYPAAASPYTEPHYITGISTSKGTYTQKDTTYDPINVGTTWDNYRGSKVKVGVIDTGLKTTHQDFNGTNISSHSYDCYNNTSTITDATGVAGAGHGTDSAAVIAAAINGVGGVGLSPNVELYIYRSVNAQNGFPTDTIRKALRRAIDDHVDIINMSIQGYDRAYSYSYVEDYDGNTYSGSTSYSMSKTSLQDLITEAHNAGITIVGAAGNYNITGTEYPAANDYVIGVGATSLTDPDKKAGLSNYGSYVDVCAPGYVVVPSISSDSSYQLWWGTSFSAPLVTGAIALYKSKYPSATPDEIEARLKATCDPLSYQGSGSGRINVTNFLNNGPAETWVDATNMTLPTSFEVVKGNTSKINPTFTPSNTTRQTCYWSSNKTSVATVDCYGNVTGISSGTATITATSIDGEFISSCTVTVKEPVPVTGVNITESSVSIEKDSTHQLVWEITPSNASNQNVIFVSDKDEIATVDENGLITAVGKGTTTIRILTEDGEFEDECEVTVSSDEPEIYNYTIGWGNATGKAGTYSNFTANSGSVANILSFTSQKNNGTNDPAYNSNSSELRLYYNSQGNGNSITINPAEKVTITSVSMTTSTTPSVKYKVDGGSLTNMDRSGMTYTIADINATSSIFIQNANTSNTQLKIYTIAFTYEVEDTSDKIINSLSATYTGGDIYQGGSLSKDDVSVTATFTKPSKYSSEAIPSSDFSLSGFSSVTPGTKEVTVTYTGELNTSSSPMTTTFNVTVKEDTITSVVASDSKLYHPGDTIVKSDITVTITYQSGNQTTTTDFTFGNDGYLFTYQDAPSGGTQGNKQFSVTFNNETYNFTVKVSRVAPTNPVGVSDQITRSTTGIAKDSTNYSNWSNKTVSSSAKYAGNSAGGNDSIQLRSSSNNSGIVSTASGGRLAKVVVEWQSSTSSGRTLNVYGKNTPYSQASDLYASSTQGTLIGTIVKGTSTELSITDDYTYIGLRSNSGAMYLTSVTVYYVGDENLDNVCNYIMYQDTNGQCTSKFSEAVNKLNTMSKADKDSFWAASTYKTNKAKERIMAWADYLGKELTYTDGKYVVNGSRTINLLPQDKGIITALIVLSITSITLVGGYLLFKRKKRQ
ncbi:MAG: S8 family serine peptidase, partial [Bacilli bacterium]|nr:S8 family serine peptidase [Bacilli bacterium]